MRWLCVPAAIHRRRALIALAIALPLWGWFDVRERGRIDPNLPGLHMTDLTVYTEAGAAFFDGRDPYRVTNSRGWSYLYPPLFAMLLAPLRALEPKTQVIIWFAISCVVVWGAYRESLKLIALAQRKEVSAQRRETTTGYLGQSNVCPRYSFPAWIALAAIGTVVLPALNCLQRGQVGILKLYLLLVGVRLVLENRSRWRALAGGMALALAVVLKITPLLPVGCLLLITWAADWKNAARNWLARPLGLSLGFIAGLLLWAIVVPSVLVGWQANAGHLRSWWSTVVVHANETNENPFAGNSQSARNQSLLNAVNLFEGSISHWWRPQTNVSADINVSMPIVHRLVLGARVLAIGLLVWLAYSAGRSQDACTQLAAFGLACAGTLVASPIARVHYFVLLLPAMLFVPLVMWRSGLRLRAYFFAFVPPVLCTLHYAWIDVAGNWGLLGLGTAVWMLAACGFVLHATGAASLGAAASFANTGRMTRRLGGGIDLKPSPTATSPHHPSTAEAGLPPLESCW